MYIHILWWIQSHAYHKQFDASISGQIDRYGMAGQPLYIYVYMLMMENIFIYVTTVCIKRQYNLGGMDEHAIKTKQKVKKASD